MKNSGTQTCTSVAPGYQAPVRQQPCSFLVARYFEETLFQRTCTLLKIVQQDSCTIDMILEAIVFILSTPIVTVYELKYLLFFV